MLRIFSEGGGGESICSAFSRANAVPVSIEQHSKVLSLEIPYSRDGMQLVIGTLEPMPQPRRMELARVMSPAIVVPLAPPSLENILRLAKVFLMP